MAPLAMGASVMIQGSKGALELLGRILLHLNQKIIFKLKKENLLNFPSACTTYSPCQTPFSCYGIAWARGSKRTQLV